MTTFAFFRIRMKMEEKNGDKEWKLRKRKRRWLRSLHRSFRETTKMNFVVQAFAKLIIEALNYVLGGNFEILVTFWPLVCKYLKHKGCIGCGSLTTEA